MEFMTHVMTSSLFWLCCGTAALPVPWLALAEGGHSVWTLRGVRYLAFACPPRSGMAVDGFCDPLALVTCLPLYLPYPAIGLLVPCCLCCGVMPSFTMEAARNSGSSTPHPTHSGHVYSLFLPSLRQDFQDLLETKGRAAERR